MDRILQGRIIKGIAGFYYVRVPDEGLFECRARGSFRKDKTKPLVGDEAQLAVLDEDARTGNLIKILERKSCLIRPEVANVDQALVLFAATAPKPNFHLLDTFLVMMRAQGIDTVICFNKADLATEEELAALRTRYEKSGSPLIFSSVVKGTGIDVLKRLLTGRITTVAGPSGAGKSSMINALQPDVVMETGAISEKIQRGKHTTRHSQLICLGGDTYIMDTPGFTSLALNLSKEELHLYFPEFAPYEGTCRFLGCMHDREPSCSVKEAVAAGEISSGRYETYLALYHELCERRSY